LLAALASANQWKIPVVLEFVFVSLAYEHEIQANKDYLLFGLGVAIPFGEIKF